MMKKSTIYKILRISNDINAIMKGKGLQRLGRRLGGRYTSKGLNNLFK